MDLFFDKFHYLTHDLIQSSIMIFANILLSLILILLGYMIITGIRIVQQQTLLVVERFGQYNRILKPGLNIIIPFLERVAYVINLRTQNLDFTILAITSDKVTITLDTSLIYQILPNQAYAVAYNLQNPTQVIKTTVENSIRAYVAKQNHEEILQKRDELTIYLVEHLTEQMLSWGYQILNFQIKDVILPSQITDAMSRVVASKRLQEAAENEANAEYIKTIRSAEAQKRTRVLQGEGLAGERKAVINGLAESITDLTSATGTTADSVLNIVMLNQYIDMLRTIGKDEAGNSKLVFMNSNPAGMSSIVQELTALMNHHQK
jgi:regulator of protease activity HflC (stomatin/prohibitin superfamily)